MEGVQRKLSKMNCLAKKYSSEVICLSEDTGRRLILDRKDLQLLNKFRQLKFPPALWSHAEPPPRGTMWVGILGRVVEKKPVMLEMLRIPANERDDISLSYDFRWFCGNFGNFWQDILLILTSPPDATLDARSRRIMDKISMMGKRHSVLRGNTRIITDAAIWNCIREELLDELQNDRQSKDLLESWRKLVNFVVDEMFDTCVSAIQKREALLDQDSVV